MGEFLALVMHHIGGIAAAAGITIGHDYMRHRRGEHHLKVSTLLHPSGWRRRK